jgi:hypothetical protein
VDVTGLLRPRGSTLAAVPGGLTSPRNASVTLYTGIFPNATFEIFTLEFVPAEVVAEGGTPALVKAVRRYLSTDLMTYTTAAPAFSVPGMVSAAVARDNITGGYLLLAFVPDPTKESNGSRAVTYTSTTGMAWATTGGGYGVDTGCAHTGLLNHPQHGWLSFQRVLQKLSSPKPIPDSVGSGFRRVVSVLVSKDGVKWTAGAAAAASLLTPGADDPPEMELGAGGLGFIPFWCVACSMRGSSFTEMQWSTPSDDECTLTCNPVWAVFCFLFAGILLVGSS